MVPSRSATEITMRVRDPSGRRIAARVNFASASALSRICFTSAELRSANWTRGWSDQVAIAAVALRCSRAPPKTTCACDWSRRKSRRAG